MADDRLADLLAEQATARRKAEQIAQSRLAQRYPSWQA